MKQQNGNSMIIEKGLTYLGVLFALLTFIGTASVGAQDWTPPAGWTTKEHTTNTYIFTKGGLRWELAVFPIEAPLIDKNQDDVDQQDAKQAERNKIIYTLTKDYVHTLLQDKEHEPKLQPSSNAHIWSNQKSYYIIGEMYDEERQAYRSVVLFSYLTDQNEWVLSKVFYDHSEINQEEAEALAMYFLIQEKAEEPLLKEGERGLPMVDAKVQQEVFQAKEYSLPKSYPYTDPIISAFSHLPDKQSQYNKVVPTIVRLYDAHVSFMIPGLYRIHKEVIEPEDGTRLFGTTTGGRLFVTSDGNILWSHCMFVIRYGHDRMEEDTETHYLGKKRTDYSSPQEVINKTKEKIPKIMMTNGDVYTYKNHYGQWATSNSILKMKGIRNFDIDVYTKGKDANLEYILVAPKELQPWAAYMISNVVIPSIRPVEGTYQPIGNTPVNKFFRAYVPQGFMHKVLSPNDVQWTKENIVWTVTSSELDNASKEKIDVINSFSLSNTMLSMLTDPALGSTFKIDRYFYLIQGTATHRSEGFVVTGWQKRNNQYLPNIKYMTFSADGKAFCYSSIIYDDTMTFDEALQIVTSIRENH